MRLNECSGVKYPADVDYLPDPNACTPAAFAYLMFCIDAPEALWTPQAMDEITGRKPGELTYNSGLVLHALLENGAKITECNDFDNQRFINEGLEYLEEYHSSGWAAKDPRAFFEYWSQQRVEAQQQHTVSFLEGTRQHGSNYAAITKVPTMRLILDALREEARVLVSTHRVEPNVKHDVVAIKAVSSDDEIVVFDNQHTPPIHSYNLPYFGGKLFNPSAGIYIVAKS